ncbi:hypothetical protein TRICI_006095 [Trichomonascus ciferrii]|uniref:Uncharacterized protein n=1 Tax=Trichomonascus ciferrii TaxID=44093 RepID=A0A642ULB3_9ASCO|nr:hypothetical protein TRICI_006095 [Trichomonascus ciferrii]
MSDKLSHIMTQITVIRDIRKLGDGVSVGVLGRVFGLYVGTGFVRVEAKDDSVKDPLYIYVYSSTFGAEAVGWLKGLLLKEPFCFFWGKHFRTKRVYRLHSVSATRGSQMGLISLSDLKKLLLLDMVKMSLCENLVDDTIGFRIGRVAVDVPSLTLEQFLQTVNTESRSKIQPPKQAARVLVRVFDKLSPQRRQYYSEQWSFWASDDSNFLPHYKRVRGLPKVNAVHFTVVNTEESTIEALLKPGQLVSFIAILDILNYDGHFCHDIRVGEIDPQWKCMSRICSPVPSSANI